MQSFLKSCKAKPKQDSFLQGDELKAVSNLGTTIYTDREMEDWFFNLSL